jgi:hypothetical protein
MFFFFQIGTKNMDLADDQLRNIHFIFSFRSFLVVLEK